MANTNGRKWVTVVLTAGGLLVGIGIGWGGKTATIEANSAAIRELRTNQQADHDTVTQLTADVRHIRDTVDKIERKLE